jgi:hypothetical protein
MEIKMKKNTALMLLLSFLIMVISPGFAVCISPELKAPVFESTNSEPVLMRYKLQRDQVLSMTVDMNTDIRMRVATQKADIVQNVRITAKARVTEVDGNGNIAVLLKITRMTMKLSGMKEAEFDSDNPDNSNPDLQAVNAMIGVGIPCKISPVGELLETDLEPLRLAVRRLNNATLTKTLEDSASKMFEGTFVQLSKDPIAAGQTYEAGTFVSGGTKMRVSYKITAVSSDKTKALMMPVMNMDVPANSIPGLEMKISKQENSGWILFDVDKGYVSEGRISGRIVMEASADGRNLLMDMTNKMVFTSNLN